MEQEVRWGVLSTAAIGTVKVIPAMQQGALSKIEAIASRSLGKAQAVAAELKIPRSYGSYEGLLEDEEIEAIYISLPNHLHVPWTIKCLEAGKHVLCEKPIALTAADVERLIEARDRAGKNVGEAFMVKTHPQWLRALELIRNDEIGELRAVQGFFSYDIRDPKNIRNIADFGGGGLWDIGCYCVTTSRLAFGEEPTRVVSLLEFDPDMKIDRLSSVIMEFPSGHASFTVGTQIVRYQRMGFFGTRKRIEITIPFNAPIDRPCRIFIDENNAEEGFLVEEDIPTCNQYTIQGDEFSKAVRGKREVPVPLEDARNNIAVIEAIFESAKSGNWESPKI
jgi:predicted dehydrogenase